MKGPVMSATPAFSPRLIGETEKTLNAILDPMSSPRGCGGICPLRSWRQPRVSSGPCSFEQMRSSRGPEAGGAPNMRVQHACGRALDGDAIQETIATNRLGTSGPCFEIIGRISSAIGIRSAKRG
jgi:hypothetical protein